MKRHKTAVIGLGNRLLSDEGAGLHALDLLRETLENDTTMDTLEVDLVEAGTPGMNLLHQLEEREKIIFIDAGNCGIDPGEYRRFKPGEVVSNKVLTNFSLHEFDLLRFLEFARRLGLAANLDVVIYCIQAADLGMSERLSPGVEKGLPPLVRDIAREILGSSSRTISKGPSYIDVAAAAAGL